MTEYWVSREKFYCKYCKIYLADDVPSKTHHDSGFRHKGNYERYIRDIYKRGEREIKDKAEEAREISRMNAAAQLAMQADGIASTSEIPIPSTSTSSTKPKAAATTSDPFANYSTAESLGYVDPNAEALASLNAELELRKNEGIIGGWEKVVTVKKEKRIRVQPMEANEDDFIPTERVGGNYLSIKKLAGEEEEIYDPSKFGGIKLKRKRLTLAEEEAIREAAEMKERIIKKEKKELSRMQREEHRRTKAGWNEIELEEEPILMFDELPMKEEDVEEEIKEEDSIGLGEEGIKEEEKPSIEPIVASGGGFKKRKMLGASATRRK